MTLATILLLTLINAFVCLTLPRLLSVMLTPQTQVKTAPQPQFTTPRATQRVRNA